MINEIPSRYDQLETRKLFGFAISKNPQDIYKAVRGRIPNETITPELLGYTTSQVVSDAYEEQTQTDNLDHNIQAADTLTLLSAGVGDTYIILKNEFNQQPTLSQEQAQVIAANPRTARTIAQLALRDQDDLRALLNEHRVRPAYFIDETNNFIVPHDSRAAPQRYGCPFAGREGIVAPAPLFTRFIEWSGLIAVQCYFDKS